MNTSYLPALVRALFVLAALRAPAGGAEIILPQGRNAFYSHEPIEVAVAGLGAAQQASVKLVPARSTLQEVTIPVVGDGRTVVVALPGHSLAPDAYTVQLDGKPVAKLTVSAGVWQSPLMVSQTGPLKEGGANFILGNFFGSGLVGPDGQPDPAPRGKRSSGLTAFENAIAKDLPMVVYMYWTGYVTHKPFGTERSWAAADMTEAMRLLSFRTAQSLRKYAANVSAVGTLDEPGLAWGRTPAGGMASGFPNWDERAWYESRGWSYTADPGSRDAADWMRYMTIRCGIMKEQNRQACKDLKSVWPSMVFATDLYAPHAIMDGCDPLNQEINDIPTSHIFMDWGVGKLGALSGSYLEKCDAPSRKLAHAMNGQLFGAKVPQPNQTDAYRAMLNALLMAGLHGNWWLNMTGMKAEDLKSVNEPAARLGPLFAGADVKGHDIAVLWSFTECAMRQKEIAAREATKKTGEQIKLMIASLPEDTAVKDGQVTASAYSVGQNYKDCILHAHQAIARAGHPAHILHERRVAEGWLKDYRVLVIIGQTFDLPADVRAGIAAFQQAGGTVITDKGTTVKFDNAVATDAKLEDIGWRWGSVFGTKSTPENKLSKKRASLYATNFFMDEPARAAAPLLKATLAKTRARPAIATDSVHLAAERHRAGEGELILVLNACDTLPDIADDAEYWIYNYAAHEATFTLQGLPPGAVVWSVEGPDWRKAGEVSAAAAPIKGSFAAGEMKVFVVAPRRPTGLDLTAVAKDGALSVDARLQGLAMPWPFTLTVTAPDGSILHSCFRGTDAAGRFAETLPLGSNAAAGDYVVRLESPLAGLTASQKVAWAGGSAARPQVVQDQARVFDEPVIAAFLATKPDLVVVYGNDGQKGFAERLAADLAARGIPASAKPESAVLRKVAYPRVWNPKARLCAASGPEKQPPSAAKAEIRLGIDREGRLTSATADGKAIDWKTPDSLVTIIGDGFVDFDNTDMETCYEPGVKLFIDDKRKVTVLKGETTLVDTTPEFRRKWARPWTRLTTYQGVNQYPAQLPEAFTTDSHLVLLGDSSSGTAVAALQASEILPQVADAAYPGPGRAIVEFAWSPFAVEKNVIFVGATDEGGLDAGATALLGLAAARKAAGRNR
jgi:hypothetical protein